VDFRVFRDTAKDTSAADQDCRARRDGAELAGGLI